MQNPIQCQLNKLTVIEKICMGQMTVGIAQQPIPTKGTKEDTGEPRFGKRKLPVRIG